MAFSKDELTDIQALVELHLEEPHGSYDCLFRPLVARIDQELDAPTLALPICPICGGVMHADNSEFLAMPDAKGGVFRHKCKGKEQGNV